MTSLLLLALATSASGSSAKSTAKALPERAFLVVVPRSDAPVPASTEAGLAAALASEKVPLADAADLFPAPTEVNAAEPLITEGKKAYDDLDVDAASKKFSEALVWLEAHPAASSDAQLAEVHMLLAACALQSGNKAGPKKAQEEFGRALNLSTGVQLDAKYFAPDAKKLFDKAKTEVASKGTAKLTAVSNPAAEATVLGLTVGPGVDVAVGKHLVTFKRTGYATAAVLVDVTKGGAEARVDLVANADYAALYKQAQAVVPAAFGGTKLPPEAKSMADAAQSRFLVLASVANASGSLEVWDTASGSRLKDVSFDGDAGFKAAAAKVKTFMSAPSPVASGKGRKGRDADDEEAGVERAPGTPVYQQKWFWPAVGGVAAVAVIATGVALVASSPKGPPSFNPVLGGP